MKGVQKERREAQALLATELSSKLPNSLKHAMEVAKKEASN